MNDTNDAAAIAAAQERLQARRAEAGVAEPSGLHTVTALAARLGAVDPAALERHQREADEVLARRRREDEARWRAARATAIGLPGHEGLRLVALDDRPPETPALVAIRAAATWRARRPVGQVTILGGPPGTGKSTSAAWMLLRRGGGCLWVDAHELGTTPDNGYSDNREVWRRWSRASTLVVDDAGLEGGEAEALAGLLCRRHDAGLWTIVTTNLGADAFAARYLAGAAGSRLSDRLAGQRARGLSAFVDTGSVSLRREGR